VEEEAIKGVGFFGGDERVKEGFGGNEMAAPEKGREKREQRER
jgi:hypothetical protein